MSGDATYVTGSDQSHTALVLYALNSQNGAIVWSDTLSTSSQDYVWEDEAGPLAMDGMVYIAVGHDLYSGSPRMYNSILYALRADTGVTAWSQQLNIAYQSLSGGPPPTILTVDAGRVFVNETDGLLHALSPSDGVEVWSAKGGVGTIGIGPGVLYQCGNVVHTSVIALRESDGVELWTQPFYAVAGMAVTGNHLVAVTMSPEPRAYLTGIRASDGVTSWQYPIESTQGAPVISSGVVYYDDGFTIDAVDINNGRLLWHDNTPDLTYSEFDDVMVSPQGHVVFAVTSPYIGEDPFFDPVTCGCLPSDKVYALNDQDGAAYWQYQLSSNGDAMGGLEFAAN
jgi:outer membrane protein assembly factor BamB